MNSKFQINKGLRMARKLLLDIAKLGLPAGCEFLDTISPQYTADLVSWGAIGARTTESQVHRELASALSMPTGFKNSTDGSIGVAVDACRAARSGHVFLSVGKEGLSSIIETEASLYLFFTPSYTQIEQGNPDVHVILRGGSKGPNYAAEHVRDCYEKLCKAGLSGKIMVKPLQALQKHVPIFTPRTDRLQSWKQPKATPKAIRSCRGHCQWTSTPFASSNSLFVLLQVQQLSSGDTSTYIMGVMIESNLVEGRQDIPLTGPAGLKYGQSVTDACLSWEMTVPALDRLREGVRARRELVAQNARGHVTNGAKEIKPNGVSDT